LNIAPLSDYLLIFKLIIGSTGTCCSYIGRRARQSVAEQDEESLGTRLCYVILFIGVKKAMFSISTGAARQKGMFSAIQPHNKTWMPITSW
jgi:hypothetical protein